MWITINYLIHLINTRPLSHEQYKPITENINCIKKQNQVCLFNTITILLYMLLELAIKYKCEYKLTVQ